MSRHLITNPNALRPRQIGQRISKTEEFVIEEIKRGNLRAHVLNPRAKRKTYIIFEDDFEDYLARTATAPKRDADEVLCEAIAKRPAGSRRLIKDFIVQTLINP